MVTRKTYTGSMKGTVAIEAVKAEKTMSELASHYEVHPNQIKTWKRHLMAHVGELFEDKRRKKQEREKEELIEELYKQIGQLKVELEWIKKRLSNSVAERRTLIEPGHPTLSLSRQAQFLDMARSSIYYAPSRSPEEVRLTRLIDTVYTEFPYYGVRRIHAELRRKGERVGKDRVRTLIWIDF